MARYHSPYYPALRVALPDGKSVKFRGAQADVPDEDMDAFEAFLATSQGRESGIVAEEDYNPVPAPESMLGVGYTEAEKAAALAALGGVDSDGVDDVADGVGAQADEMPPEGQHFTESSAEALVDDAPQASQDGPSDAGDQGAAEDMPGPDADQDGPHENGLDELSKPELVAEAEAQGLPTSGTKASLIDRLRGNG